ncbi:hypothetical protein GCM10007094_25580 [Pseudovibrio japonicus]|uniref:Uncharacterized protein n=1 Tax=Pseudovibrio japonicus TaxID=366534 RepID=A0ABQ3EHL7_9HYPH|nr:hypothetical protein [Pseudovibrio japonicus]GHB34995.1 hypothetical protein GCM10007094_25580 [Pseudovibrio japonicus]
MFANGTCKKLLSAASLAAALSIAATAHAKNGVLLTLSMCSDSNGFRDAYWAQKNTGAKQYPNVFYMREGGSIVKVIGTDDLADITDLMITAHGNCSQISTWTNSQFARLLKANLPVSKEIKTLTTVSCHGADTIGPKPETNSLLTELQKYFVDADLITGFKGVASIAGDGNGILDSKFSGNSYTDNVVDLGKLQAAKVANETFWKTTKLKIGVIDLPLRDFCDKVSENASFFSDNLLGDTIKALYEKTVDEIETQNSGWSDITKLLKTGAKPAACGPKHNVDAANYSSNNENCNQL